MLLCEPRGIEPTAVRVQEVPGNTRGVKHHGLSHLATSSFLLKQKELYCACHTKRNLVQQLQRILHHPAERFCIWFGVGSFNGRIVLVENWSIMCSLAWTFTIRVLVLPPLGHLSRSYSGIAGVFFQLLQATFDSLFSFAWFPVQVRTVVWDCLCWHSSLWWPFLIDW